MWCAHRDGVAEGCDEMMNILDSLFKRQIAVLCQSYIRMTLKYNQLQAGVMLTLRQVNITLRRLGILVETIPIRLNTSIQNNGYHPSMNFFSCSRPRLSSFLRIEHRWFDQYKQLYCKVSEMFCSIRDWRSLILALASRESSRLQMLKWS